MYTVYKDPLDFLFTAFASKNKIDRFQVLTTHSGVPMAWYALIIVGTFKLRFPPKKK